MPRACIGMEQLQVDFTTALAHLQGLIGTEVRVVINFYGRFFGAGFQGELTSVQTLPPDAAAIRLVLSGGQGLLLDPTDLEAFIARAGEGDEWLEFHVAFGVAVTVEPVGTEI